MKQIPTDSLFAASQPFAQSKTLPVLGFDLVNASSKEAIRAILSPGRRKIAFMNAHCANVASRKDDYAVALHRADMILPDGVGIEIAAKLAGTPPTENLNGTDLGPKLMAEAAKRGKSVYLLGGTPGTAEKAARTIQMKVPGLRVAGTSDGFDGLANAVQDINASGADILLVALGVPLQELWIDENFDLLDVQVALGVGALLDFWAGNAKRAPAIVRKSRMEWAWRLMMEPRRLAKRYLIGNMSFLARVAANRLSQISATDMAKRALDIAGSVIALILLGPLLLLTALAIRLESPGAPIFQQTRVGRDGRHFTLYKFRSMSADAESRRAAVAQDSDREGICFKSRQDPRVTRIGRLLRRFSIDELPQIFNVLLGHMSIVGPRPGLPSEVAAYSPLAQQRLAVKPGLTGLWQVSGRADIGFDQMIAMDLAYANSRSVLLDMLIIRLTLRAVLTGRGAY